LRAELIEGHKDVTPVIVPFDPQELWGIRPIKIDPRREGRLVRGTMNGAPFEGWMATAGAASSSSLIRLFAPQRTRQK